MEQIEEPSGLIPRGGVEDDYGTPTMLPVARVESAALIQRQHRHPPVPDVRQGCGEESSRPTDREAVVHLGRACWDSDRGNRSGVRYTTGQVVSVGSQRSRSL